MLYVCVQIDLLRVYMIFSINVQDVFFSYRGGVDSEGHPVMVVVGAHFLLRCLDLERFVLYVVKVIWLYPAAGYLFLLASISWPL